MKIIKQIAVAFFMLIALSVSAQQGINYKALIKDGSGAVVANDLIQVQFIILDGAANVYEESHTPTTDGNGIVILNIGEGLPIGGSNFSTIDWSRNNHFLNVQINTGGGLTDMGTTAFKTVPYALQAKTAENIFSGDYNDLSNLPSIPTTYAIGDFAHGGIVFWVNETGQHGLVCTKQDQSSGIRWYAGTFGNTRAEGDGIYAGKANTAIIIAAQVAIGDDNNTYAARLCNELQITEGSIIYGDWYLPSKFELNEMYANKATIDATATANGGAVFTAYYYWSSTDTSFLYAWAQDFISGSQDVNFGGKTFTLIVRAIRAF